MIKAYIYEILKDFAYPVSAEQVWQRLEKLNRNNGKRNYNLDEVRSCLMKNSTEKNKEGLWVCDMKNRKYYVEYPKSNS